MASGPFRNFKPEKHRTMKKLYTLTILTAVIIIFTACSETQNTGPVVNENEIEKYLTTESFEASSGLESATKNIEFWKKKLASDSRGMTYHAKLAGAYSSRFGITKNIEDLQRADSLYRAAYQLPGGQNVGNLQALAQLSITQHHFKEAQKYSFKALAVGDEKATSHLLLFDTMMERGDYELAKQNLNRLKNTSSFAYLIRLSKYKDYEGKLDSAIYYMEKAAKRIDHNSGLRAWSKSNLADMYGHANRVQDSYDAYLQVLQEEQTGGAYLHSLEGIAWIAYAHDGNTELAKKILQFVDEQIKSPDVNLKLAEIAEYEGKSEQKEKYLKAFIEEAKKPAYFGMYDAYLVEIAATEMDNYDWAMQLVDEELKNRPNPQTYDLKAWTYLYRGEFEKALAIIENKVKGHTYEPVPAYHMAKIYKANGMTEEARKYFKEALAASYELGPVIKQNIRQELRSL